MIATEKRLVVVVVVRRCRGGGKEVHSMLVVVLEVSIDERHDKDRAWGDLGPQRPSRSYLHHQMLRHQ